MRYALLFLSGLLAGCAIVDQIERPVLSDNEMPVETSAPPPPRDARTVEDFDTTTAEERAAAAAASEGGQRLGRTVASLGDPTRPGFWLLTSLVTEETPGRLEFPEKGTSVDVTLLPSDGGSARVSLAALRLLEAPLADLSELDVFAR